MLFTRRLALRLFSSKTDPHLYKEVLQNPEILSAFPHLKTRFLQASRKRSQMNRPGDLLDGAGDFQDKPRTLEEELDDLGTKIPLRGNRNERDAESQDYFDSLLNRQQKQFEKDALQRVRDNYENYTEAYRTAEGPLRLMTPQAIDKVHAEADIKLQELEETGLSRTELLYDKAGGLPLADDPAFQFLKRNRLARQMLFKPSELFTVSRVVAKALRQDIKPDDSVGRDLPENVGYRKEDDQYRNYKNKYRLKKTYHDPENFHAGPDWAQEKLNQMKRKSERAPIYMYRPMTRKLAYLKNKRKVTKQDFDWEDIDLVCKFLTTSGLMMNKFQTRLPFPIQKHVSKLAKKLKDMDLLPHAGVIKPSDKVPMKSLLEEVEDQLQQLVDPVTGRIIPKEQSPSGTREARFRLKEGTVDTVTLQKEPREHKFSQNFDMDVDKWDLTSKTEEEELYAPIKMDGKFFIAQEEQLEWLKAQHYAEEGIEGGKMPGAEKEAYERIISRLSKLGPGDLASAYLQETQLDVNGLEKRGAKVRYSKEEASKVESKLEIINEINRVLERHGITGDDLQATMDAEWLEKTKPWEVMSPHPDPYIPE